MMDIEKLKERIENKTIDDTPVIFVVSDTDFVARQYIHQISKLANLEIEQTDDISKLGKKKKSLIEMDTKENSIILVAVDELGDIGTSILGKKNLYVITKKLSPDFPKELSQIVVKVPKLETWQIRDYAYSVADGVKREKLDWLLQLCGNNIYRLDNELQKLSQFSKTQRADLFDNMVYDGSFDDLMSVQLFDLSNAVCTKDLQKLSYLVPMVKESDINEFAVVAILLNSFKNMARVQLSKNPEIELKDMSSKQIYAIRKNCGKYSKDQLNKVLQFLYSIDYKIKSGNLDIENTVEYLVDKILTV